MLQMSKLLQQMPEPLCADALQRCPSWQHLPDGASCQRHLPDAVALSSLQGLPRSGNSSAQTSASLHPPRRASASNIFPMALRRSAPASNKPHSAEKSTPVWLAIWRIWAGFANSQHRDAAYAASNNICAHFPSLPHRVAAQTDANLSAHLHRLPTPPPYLCQMRLSPGWGAGIRCWMRRLPGKGRRCRVLDMAAAWPGAAFLQITARTNPCSRHLWGTLARAVASI